MHGKKGTKTPTTFCSDDLTNICPHDILCAEAQNSGETSLYMSNMLITGIQLNQQIIGVQGANDDGLTKKFTLIWGPKAME